MTKINLNASMRSNLLSLQQSQTLQDATQLRLSTGLKVNSAIDNPSSYYTAQSLNNRAADLTLLLDSMGQGIQTIKTANEALQSATIFLTQASAVAMQAVEKNPTPTYNGPIAASVTSQSELTDAINNWHLGDGVIVIENDITFTKDTGIIMKEGMQIVGKNFMDAKGEQAKLTFDFDNSTKAIGIDLNKNAKLSDLKVDYTTAQKTGTNNFNAIRNNGFIGVELNNLDIIVKSDDASLGYTSGIRNVSNGEITLNGKINISAPSTVGRYVTGVLGSTTTTKLTQNADSVLTISTSGRDGYGIIYGVNNLSGTVNIATSGQSGTGISYSTNTLSGIINISTSGDNGYGIMYGTQTISGTVNIKNSGTNGLGLVYGNTTLTKTANVLIQSQKSYALYATVTTSNTITYEQGAKLGLYSGVNASTIATAGLWQANSNGTFTDTAPRNNLDDIANFSKIGNFPQAEFDDAFKPKQKPTEWKNIDSIKQYNTILDQYDMLISDSSYKGINLLNAQDLSVMFNENRSSKLDVKGVDASTTSLGLKKAELNQSLEDSIKELSSAINKIQGFMEYFGNNFEIVSNRETFTNNLINTLTEGADKLILADMNKESADMLALQTRQQLATNALSLASQSAQSVLKLFS